MLKVILMTMLFPNMTMTTAGTKRDTKMTRPGRSWFGKRP